MDVCGWVCSAYLVSLGPCLFVPIAQKHGVVMVTMMMGLHFIGLFLALCVPEPRIDERPGFYCSTFLQTCAS